jgi:hypothetical protein
MIDGNSFLLALEEESDLVDLKKDLQEIIYLHGIDTQLDLSVEEVVKLLVDTITYYRWKNTVYAYNKEGPI